MKINDLTASTKYGALPRVVQVLDEYKIVINKGIDDEVEEGDNYLIFALGDEIVDPETKENLGRLEVVRGKARVIHVQERLSTLKSTDRTDSGGRKRVVRSGIGFLGSSEIIEDIQEQDSPLTAVIGDYAKPI
jgi:hypothetical protein